MPVRALTPLIGLWLLFEPTISHAAHSAATISYVAGPLVIFTGALSLRDVTRGARFLLVVPALLLIAAPIIAQAALLQIILALVVAWLLLALTGLRGPARQTTGGGWLGLLRLPNA